MTNLKKVAILLLIIPPLAIFLYEELVVLVERQHSRTTEGEAVLPAARDVLEKRIRSAEEVKKTYAVDFDNEGDVLKILDRNGSLMLSLPRRVLDLNKHFPRKEGLGWPDLVHIDGEVSIREGDTLFFPVSRSGYCGANNCTWYLYAYWLGEANPQPILGNIFGNVTKILLSPDKEKIAVLSYVHGGHCNDGEYLYILDRKSGETARIEALNLAEYLTTHSTSLRWMDDSALEAVVTNSNCGLADGIGRSNIKRQVICILKDVAEPECRSELVDT